MSKKVQKGTKRSRTAKTDFVEQKQTERARSETKKAGVKKLSSFRWTFMVTKEHGKRTTCGVDKFHRATHLRKCFLYKHIGNRSEHVGQFYMAPPSRKCFCINTLGKRYGNVGNIYRAPPSRTCFLYEHIGEITEDVG